MAKKSYGNSQTNNQIPESQQNKEQISILQKIVKEIPFFAFIIFIVGIVWFVNHSPDGDKRTMTESTTQSDTSKFISSEATENDAIEEVSPEDEETNETVEESNTEYSFDGMTAEKIVALCGSFDDKFCIPEEGESEDDYKKRLKDTFNGDVSYSSVDSVTSDTNNFSLFHLYTQISDREYDASDGYTYEKTNGITSADMCSFPAGHFEHYIDGDSKYIIDSYDIDKRIDDEYSQLEAHRNSGVMINDGVFSESEFVAVFMSPVMYDYSHYKFSGDYRYYLARYKEKKLIDMTIAIDDYETAMSVYDLFSKYVKETYADYPLKEISEGDFYIVEQQDTAQRGVYADIGSTMPFAGFDYAPDSTYVSFDDIYATLPVLDMRYNEKGHYVIHLLRMVD